MIDIVLNGAPRHFETALTVAALLEREGLLGKRVAVEKNGEIVPKSLHATTPVESGDQLEIVVAVGGG
ncbi:MAG: sulfur carrier protein ThiS [Pseudomonadota bacterium]